MNRKESKMNPARHRLLRSCWAAAIAALGPIGADSTAQTAVGTAARTIVALQPSRQASTATIDS